MNTEAEQADDDVASVVDKVEVNEYFVPTLGERAPITHYTHRQQATVQHLNHANISVSQQENKDNIKITLK